MLTSYHVNMLKLHEHVIKKLKTVLDEIHDSEVFVFIVQSEIRL